MRHITEKGLALIQRFEGFAAKPYLCPAGYLTVGYGHVVLDGERARFLAEPITEEEGQEILARDVQNAEAAVERLIHVPLSDGQFDALVSFVFNLGAGRLQSSTLRRKINTGLHSEAPAEFRKWVFAGGKRLPGLIRRRDAEARLYAMPGDSESESEEDSSPPPPPSPRQPAYIAPRPQSGFGTPEWLRRLFR